MPAIVMRGEPYRLNGKRLAFTSWFFIRPGRLSWSDNHGNAVGLDAVLEAGEAKSQAIDPAHGVELFSCQAERQEPFLAEENDREEGGILIATIIKDEGMYRAWAMTSWGDLRQRGQGYFCYFESEDAYHWKRPDCGIIALDGSTNNNLLGRYGGTVFVDTSSTNERYKWVSEAHFTKEEFEAYLKKYPEDVDPLCKRGDANVYFGIRGAVSSGGLHWKVLSEPLVMEHTDTQLVGYYDACRKAYVCYTRAWMLGKKGDIDDSNHVNATSCWPQMVGGRRSIGRTESENFRHFPVSQTIVTPPVWFTPNQVLYTNCRCAFPGAEDTHLMFPAVWDQFTDSTHIELLVSHDGIVWDFYRNGPVLRTADFGRWDGGCVFSSPNLIELSNGDFVLPYTGYNVPHKYPRQKARRATAYMVWPRGRLIGIRAREYGEFTTVAMIPPGQKMMINAITRRGGSIRVEAAAPDGNPIPGREFENALPLFGDCYQTPVCWKAHDDLGLAPGQPVMLRFKIKAGCVYFLDFV